MRRMSRIPTSCSTVECFGSGRTRRGRVPFSRSGFGAVEALLAVGIGLGILTGVWWMVTSSGRVMERGQSTLESATQAEILFRHLNADLHTLVSGVDISPSIPQLHLSRHLLESGVIVDAEVSWSFHGGLAGSKIERTVKTARGEDVDRMCVGILDAFSIDPFPITTHPGTTVSVSLRAPKAPEKSLYQATIFHQNQILDPRWNPVSTN